jgi:hypothetical protein
LEKLSLDQALIQNLLDQDSESGRGGKNRVLNIPPNESLVAWSQADAPAVLGGALASSQRRPGTGTGIIQLQAPRAVPLLLSADEQSKLDHLLEHQYEYRLFLRKHHERFEAEHARENVRVVHSRKDQRSMRVTQATATFAAQSGRTSSSHDHRTMTHSHQQQVESVEMKQVYLSMDDEYSWQHAQTLANHGAPVFAGGEHAGEPIHAWEQQQQDESPQMMASEVSPRTTTQAPNHGVHPYAQHLKQPDLGYVNPNPQVSRARRVQRLRTMNLPQMSVISVNQYYNALSRLMAGAPAQPQQQSITVTHTQTHTHTQHEEVTVSSSYGVVGRSLPPPNVSTHTTRRPFQPSLTLAAIAQSSASKSLPFNQSMAVALPLSNEYGGTMAGSESATTYRIKQQEHREKLQLRQAQKEQAKLQATQKHQSQPGVEHQPLQQYQFHMPIHATPSPLNGSDSLVQSHSATMTLEQIDARSRQMEVQLMHQSAVAGHATRTHQHTAVHSQSHVHTQTHTHTHTHTHTISQSTPSPHDPSHFYPPSVVVPQDPSSVISQPVLHEMLQIGQHQEQAMREYEQMRTDPRDSEVLLQQQLQQQEQIQQAYYLQQQQQLQQASYHAETMSSPRAAVPFFSDVSMIEDPRQQQLQDSRNSEQNMVNTESQPAIEAAEATEQPHPTATDLQPLLDPSSSTLSLSRVASHLASAIAWANANRFPVTEKRSTRQQRRKKARKGEAQPVPKKMQVPVVQQQQQMSEEQVEGELSDNEQKTEDVLRSVPPAAISAPSTYPATPPIVAAPVAPRRPLTRSEIDALANAAFERRWQRKKEEIMHGRSAAAPPAVSTPRQY